jgi:hypothetical protein
LPNAHGCARRHRRRRLPVAGLGSHIIHFGGEINVPSGQPGGPLDFIENINYMITVTAR